MAGTTVEHPKLGKINFSNKGYKKPISFSADERKLRIFPYLPEIIKSGKIISSENDRYSRKNINEWVVLSSSVKIDNKQETIRVNVRKDSSGNLYYDHVIRKSDSGTAYNDSQSNGFNSNISDTDEVVNIFFDNE